jgi:hypothetical protein
MSIFLLVITLVAIVAAGASLYALRRLQRGEQARSDARVAALVAAADPLPVHAEAHPQPVRLAAPQPPARKDGTWTSVAGEWQWNPNRESGGSPARNSDARSSVPIAFDDDTSIASSNDAMFGTVQRDARSSPRFAFVAGLALIVALAGAVAVFTTSTHRDAHGSARDTSHAGPLELVSLGHSRDANTLTISGVVRNPRVAPKVEGLTAVVSLIDEHGGLISTKDVPLDYRALGPGEEAPFKVTVPDPGSVARYRVSFRAGTDVIPHVDRRTDAKLASAL